MDYRIELEVNGMGQTLADSLEAIDKYGSMSKASREIGISYATVWKYVNQYQERTGEKIVKTGIPCVGTQLSDAGRMALKRYNDALEAACNAVAEVLSSCE